MSANWGLSSPTGSVLWLLDDGLERWAIAQTKDLTPGSWSGRLGTVKVNDRDGVIVAPSRFYGEGSVGCTIHVFGDNRADLLANQAMLMAGLRAGTVLTFTPDGVVFYRIGVVVKSVSAQYVDEFCNQVVVSWLVPYPFWTGKSRNETVTAGEHMLPFQGSGPVRLRVSTERPVTGLTITCTHSGEAFKFASNQAKQLKDEPCFEYTDLVGVEDVGRVWPNMSGGYKVRVSTTPNVAVKLSGEDSFL